MGSREVHVKKRSANLLLKGHADTIRIDRAEFFRPPGLGLKRSVGMDLAALLLVLGIEVFNTLYDYPDHGLVSNFPRQYLVGHPSDVQRGSPTIDTDVVWWGTVTEDFLEAANLGPPIQRRHRIRSR